LLDDQGEGTDQEGAVERLEDEAGPKAVGVEEPEEVKEHIARVRQHLRDE
jgi:hypothetical protein